MRSVVFGAGCRWSRSRPARLRPAGARLVTGTATAEGKPSGMFVAHAAAIGEAWLAVRDHGPAVGIELTEWATDRAGWQEWAPPALYGASRLRRLTPDAVLQARVVDGDVAGDAAAFVEIDLATMTQNQLKEKLARYRAYASDRVWEGRFAHCPPLLVLTTTTARATNFIRAVRRAQAGERPARFYRQADADLAAADDLVVAACGLVRDPGRAVTEPVWLLPEEAAAELTLTELLAERVSAQQTAQRWREQIRIRQRDEARRDALDDVARRGRDELARLLADPGAGEALAVLAAGPARFLERHPDLALLVVDWWGPRGARRPHGPPPARLVDALRERHAAMWAGHARAVLAAAAHHAADDPRLAGMCARLTAGRLLSTTDRDHLAAGPADRRRLQAEALTAYTERRRAAVEREHAALPWLARRRTSVDELAAGYDTGRLLICDVCGMVVPRAGGDPDAAVWDGFVHQEGHGCGYCGTGQLQEPGSPVPPLTERLAAVRARLRATPSASG